jgi:hypothetical protein
MYLDHVYNSFTPEIDDIFRWTLVFLNFIIKSESGELD